MIQNYSEAAYQYSQIYYHKHQIIILSQVHAAFVHHFFAVILLQHHFDCIYTIVFKHNAPLLLWTY